MHGNSKNEIRYKTDEDGKKRGANMKGSKTFMKERSIDGLSILR